MSQIDKVEHYDEAQIAPEESAEDKKIIRLSAEDQKAWLKKY